MENKRENPVNEMGQTEEEFLKEYSPKEYERPSVTVDIPIFIIDDTQNNGEAIPCKKLKVLLIKRKNHPFINSWALPGGFAEKNETLEEAASRELLEETGVKDIYLEQLYTIGTPNRDPRSWVITCAYMALVNENKFEVTAADDAKEAQWFYITMKTIKEEINRTQKDVEITRDYCLQLENTDVNISCILRKTITTKKSATKTEYKIIENNGLAFDHGHILALAIERLREKFMYSDIALNFLPEKFTRTDIEQVYEAVFQNEILSSNFESHFNELIENINVLCENKKG